MRSVLEVVQLADAPFAAVAVRRVPTEDEIIGWLEKLRVPYGEQVLIEYDADGPTRIRTESRGNWVRYDIAQQTSLIDRPGIRTVAADGFVFLEEPAA